MEIAAGEVKPSAHRRMAIGGAALATDILRS
jgi:hypothetical protein